MPSRKDIVRTPWPTAACRQRSWLYRSVALNLFCQGLLIVDEADINAAAR
jgi:hypothetical protein